MKTYKCSRCYPKNAKVITVPTYHHIQAASREQAVSVMQSRFPSDFRFEVVEPAEENEQDFSLTTLLAM